MVAVESDLQTRRSEQAQALVEFLVILPILLTVLFGVIEAAYCLFRLTSG